MKATNEIAENLKQFLTTRGIAQADVADSLGVSKQYVNGICNGRNVIGKVVAEKLEKYYGLSSAYLLTGKGSIAIDEDRYEETHISETEGVPYYNVDFTLGFDLLENDQTTQPDYYVNFAPYNRCTCWINARGDSMSPTISSGDIVALQRIEDFRYLISGEIYAVVTKNGLRTIKRVNDMGQEIKLIPDNKDYAEQMIPKEELLAVFLVKGNVKAY